MLLLLLQHRNDAVSACAAATVCALLDFKTLESFCSSDSLTAFVRYILQIISKSLTSHSEVEYFPRLLLKIMEFGPNISPADKAEIHTFCQNSIQYLQQDGHDPVFTASFFDLCSFLLYNEAFMPDDTMSNQWSSMLVASISSKDANIGLLIQLISILQEKSCYADPSSVSIQILELFLLWENWTDTSSFYGMTRFICVMLTKYSKNITTAGIVEKITYISSKLLANRQFDHLGYQLSNCALYSFLPYLGPDGICSLLNVTLRRVQQTKTQRDMIEMGRIMCNMYLSAKSESKSDWLKATFENIQPGLFDMIFNAAIIVPLRKLPVGDDRKLLVYVALEYLGYFIEKSGGASAAILNSLLASQGKDIAPSSQFSEQHNTSRLKYSQPIKYHPSLGLIPSEIELLRTGLGHYYRSGILSDDVLRSMDRIIVENIRPYLI